MDRDIDKILYCTKCGSTNVKTKMCVNLDTNIIANIGSCLKEEDDGDWCNCCKEHVRLMTLAQLWDKFCEIPVDKDNKIAKKFMNFLAGTSKSDVWRWFDDRCPNNLYEDLPCPPHELGEWESSMIMAQTANGTRVWVYFYEDENPYEDADPDEVPDEYLNKKGYYCVIYLDRDGEKYDDFVIHPEELAVADKETIALKYISEITEY